MLRGPPLSSNDSVSDPSVHRTGDITSKADDMGATVAETSSSTAAALVGALSKVSANAVPGLVDALLLTTQCSSSSLLLGLLEHFPDVYKTSVVEKAATSVKVDIEIIYTYLAAVLHLLKNKESGKGDLLRALWTACVPLLRTRDPDLSILQIQVAEMLAEATAARSQWDIVKDSLVPLCLDSFYASSSLEKETTSAKDSKNTAIWQELENEYKVVSKASALLPYNELLSIYAVSQLVAALLNAALEASNCMVSEHCDGKLDGGPTSPQKFCKYMVAIFLGPAFAAFKQPLDESLRRYSMQNLLPPLLTSATRLGWCDDSSSEKGTPDARTSSMEELWLCCQTLLSQGSSQRRDAYMALALFVELLFPSEFASPQNISSNNISDINQNRKFDIRDEVEFWEMLKMGLGDPDSLTRKRALFIIKRALSSLQPSTAVSKSIERKADAPLKSYVPGKNGAKGPNNEFSTKRNKWAEEEAASLGVVALKDKMTLIEGGSQRWDSFILLHETLEEYGTHLVEAAWSHQMSFLLQFTKSKGETRNSAPYWAGTWSQKKSRNVDVNFAWISVLWQRGFDHTNPQVRRLVMQSFLEFEWEQTRKLSSLLPENYVLEPLLQALDDPAQHRDFGVKGIYSSTSAEGAAKFMSAYSTSLPPKRRIGFVMQLAKALLAQSRTRPGLMTLSMCLESAAVGFLTRKVKPVNLEGEQTLSISDVYIHRSDEGPVSLLELLKSVVENSKRHFNPKYRAKVCGHVLRAASALVVLPNIPFQKFAFFLSSFPRECLVYGGSLHNLLSSWVYSSESASGPASQCDVNKWIVEGLQSMAEILLKSTVPLFSPVTDEDVETWRMEAGRWARLLFIGLVKSNDLLGIILFIEQHALQIYNHAYTSSCTSVRLLLLIQSLFKECTSVSDLPLGRSILTTYDCNKSPQSESRSMSDIKLTKSITHMVLSILDEVKDFATRCAAIFWEHDHSDPIELPAAVSGKLGGPSQRRLPSTLTSAVLQAVLAISTVSDCCLWCCRVGQKMDIPESVLNFLWQYAWKAVATPGTMNEVAAELQLAAYEALKSVCHTVAATAHSFYVSAAHASMSCGSEDFSSVPLQAELMVDGLVKVLLQSVDASALVGALSRSRRAVITAHKWSCLDSLLSIPKSAVSGDESFSGDGQFLSAVSSSTLEVVLQDSIDSLESAGEEYLLPLLRSIRWLMGWGVLAQIKTDDDPEKKYQIMWTLVQSGWSAMADCNKRRVAPTAAFLSALFNPAIFSDLEMHGSQEDEEEHGPLKWLLNRLIEQGSRSPRTMRLTALHITGLWLMFPGTTVFYMQELKKLALHGGESVDEELDGEIMESQTSAQEYATLIQSSDPELTEEFTNSEMYVRVTVAVMVHKLATLVEDKNISKNATEVQVKAQAANFGQRFLLELLTAVAEDTDLSKELYKKNSAIHRRKVRVWQLLCILSRFLIADYVLKVTSLLKVCLHRNNMPSVRQYIEIFSVQFYLRFPHLVEESLIPILHDHNMRTQALSSYVLIATNVLMFTPATLQGTLLQQILPAIFPFMTSHHHTLRSFTQILIYKILRRFSTSGLFSVKQGTFAEVRCLQSVADYLEHNADCTRMRVSVEKHMDAFDPFSTAQPRGIFCHKYGEIDPTRSADDAFECVPVAVLDHVGYFLSEAREELRESMAADALVLSAEQFSSHPNGVDSTEAPTTGHSKIARAQEKSGVSTPVRSSLISEMSSTTVDSTVLESPDFLAVGNLDIQKKISSLRFSEVNAAYDVEEGLLLSSVESRAKELIRMRGGRQELIVVASLLARIPNLAGLARTCEIFKASSLVVADASIAKDRQFQLISVTADQWIPLVEVSEAALSNYLNSKRKEGYSVLGLEQTANSVSIERYVFPKKVVLVLGRETDGIPVDIIQTLDTCVEIPQLGVIRSLNVHVSGAIAIWEYTRQHINCQPQSSVHG